MGAVHVSDSVMPYRLSHCHPEEFFIGDLLWCWLRIECWHRGAGTGHERKLFSPTSEVLDCRAHTYKFAGF